MKRLAQLVWLGDKGVALGVAGLDSNADLTWFTLDLTKLSVVDTSNFTFSGDVTAYFKFSRNIRFDEESIVGVKSSVYNSEQDYTEIEVYPVEGTGVPTVPIKVEGSRLSPGMAGSSLPPVDEAEDNGKLLSIADGLPSWVPKSEVIPDSTEVANDSYLSVIEGKPVWVSEPNFYPDITELDDEKILFVLDGSATWVAKSVILPEVVDGDEGKALSVTESGGVEWADPFDQVGTGLLEFDIDGNLTPKTKVEMFNELNIGQGHLELDPNGDVMLKEEGSYTVGSTLPGTSEEDDNKILYTVGGTPVWKEYPTYEATTEVKGLIEDSHVSRGFSGGGYRKGG